MEMTFTAVFEEVLQTDGGGFLAYAEELPGAISEGDSLDEARENLRDAIDVLLQANRDLATTRTAGQKVIREQISIPVA